MKENETRAWIEVDLDAIEHNYHAIRRFCGPDCRFLGVVKADAYGHGDLAVARRLSDCGADYLAVATVDEGLHLRMNGITLPILILGRSDPHRAGEIVACGLTQAVGDRALAEAISKAAVRFGKSAVIHLKLDSGMGRLGFICHNGRDPANEIADLLKLPGLEWEGVFTHFAVSEDLDSDFTLKQFNAFVSTVDRLEALSGKQFKIRHCANSGATQLFPQMHLDMVRPGLALYGLYPGSSKANLDLRPAMALKARIIHLYDAEPGYTISYGRTHTVHSSARIAVVSIGYGDGLHRVLSNRVEFLVHGQRVPQVGNICMDMCMADISGIPDVQVGDMVTLFGSDGDACISADEMAALAGTIPYEIFCDLSPRLPRNYI